MNYLNIENLCKTYGKDCVLNQVSLHIKKQEAVGLLGANGAGKSTLIKSVLGLVKPDTGTIFSFEPPAYLAEQAQLPLSLSAMELLTFKCRSINFPIDAAKKSLIEFSLPEKSHHKPIRSYSKGMRQRTALALTLCNHANLILLDEPMSGLDALGRADILSNLKQRNRDGASILMSSHIVSDMVQLCSRVLIMAKGKVRESITIHEHSLEEARNLEQRLKFWTEKTVNE